jgi:hypothetical protein
MPRPQRQPRFSLDQFMHALGLEEWPYSNDEGYERAWWNRECQFYGVRGDEMVVDLWGYSPEHAQKDANQYGGEYLVSEDFADHAGVRHVFPVPTSLDAATARFVAIGELTHAEVADVRQEYAAWPLKALLSQFWGIGS